MSKLDQIRALREGRATVTPIVTPLQMTTTSIVTRGHRKRIYATNAERQRAYRQRRRG